MDVNVDVDMDVDKHIDVTKMSLSEALCATRAFSHMRVTVTFEWTFSPTFVAPAST